MNIYIMRHGESVDDIEDSYGGIADYPLSDSGRETAKELASKLSDAGIQKIFTSPYKRAYQTAEIIKDTVHCEIEVIEDLRERNSYGVLSGVNKDKAKEIFGHILINLDGKPGDYYGRGVLPGDEDRNSFDQRVKAAFEQVIANSGEAEVVGIMTHGNVTRSMYRNILGVAGEISLDLLSLTIIDYKPASLEIVENQGVTVKE